MYEVSSKYILLYFIDVASIVFLSYVYGIYAFAKEIKIIVGTKFILF
jgi:hypothetical protein